MSQFDRYVEIICQYIKQYTEEGKPVKAALLVEDPCSQVEVCNSLCVNRSPTPLESYKIKEYCKSIGFKWYEVLKTAPRRTVEEIFGESTSKESN